VNSVRRASASAILAASLVLLVSAGQAAAAEPAAPHWTIISQPAPTDFHPGDNSDFYEVFVVNDGSVSATGDSKLTDTLPEGVTINAVNGVSASEAGCEEATSGATVTLTCPLGAVGSGGTRINNINVSVPPTASGFLENSVTISAGGAQPASTTNSTAVTPEAQVVPFGVSMAAAITGESGVETRAGSHPFSLTNILAFNVGSTDPSQHCNEFTTPSCAEPTDQAKDVEVALPPGLVGNPTNIPYCTQELFENPTLDGCPASTQVGHMDLYFYGPGTANQSAAVYNIEPPPGQPGELGFTISTLAHIPIFFHLRSDGDYGLTADVANINQFDPVRAVDLSIWGNPSDAAHDHLRESELDHCDFGCASGVLDPKPFLTLPTSCPGSPLPLSVAGDSWQNPLIPRPVFGTVSLAPMTGCNQLDFKPSLQARPTTDRADSPSGLHVDVHIPQDHSGPGGGESPEGLATAHLRDTTVTLPKGLTVNPSSAAGLQGCSPAQIGLTSPEGATPIRTTTAPAACPDASKLGTVEVDTPLLKDPLPGAVYLAQPYDNPFKSLLALYITVNDPKTSTVVKLAGHVQIGPDGQLTTTLSESPQVPFEDFKLDFFEGARAPLRTPSVCGNYETTSQLTPWSAPESGPPASKSDSYAISSGPNGHACANTEAAEPNSPAFVAGTASPLAGAYSPFSLHLHREDGSQNFAALNVTLPPGLIGKLAGVGECSDSALAAAANTSGAAEQASPSCPASSKIGTVNVAAGAGPSPFNAGGTAYLAGPYKSAPLSVAIVTPAVAGPFDLGTVVVRSALHIDPETAQVSVTSDPIPTSLQGIQLDIRSIDVNLDRPQFTLNPTNCERFAVSGSELSSLGNTASLSNPFQVGECAKLPFSPKLKINLKGKTKRTGHPALRAVVTEGVAGEANVAHASVALPHSEFLDQAHIGTVCTRVQFNEGGGDGEKCPAASVYGRARAITPLLDQPLEGPVYLRSSNHKLPDLVAALNGQVNIDLDGRIDTDKAGGIRTTFETVPDAEVSKFVLEMKGGKKGLLVNSENLCRKPQRATAKILAQNGKNADQSPLIANDCKAGKGKRKSKAAKSGGTHR
jgi:hypothetical protein